MEAKLSLPQTPSANYLSIHLRECPLDLKEAISSLCFAAPTCTDLPELIYVQMDFAKKLDEEFVAAVTKLMPEYGVSCQLTDFVAGLTGGLLGINNLLRDLTNFSLAANMSKTLNTLTHS
ncbi:IST1-like protein [Tanacetum coccineum]